VDRGLKVSRKKTEYLIFCDESEGEFSMQGNNLQRVESFKYLGSNVAGNDDLHAEITHIIKQG